MGQEIKREIQVSVSRFFCVCVCFFFFLHNFDLEMQSRSPKLIRITTNIHCEIRNRCYSVLENRSIKGFNKNDPTQIRSHFPYVKSKALQISSATRLFLPSIQTGSYFFVITCFVVFIDHTGTL